MLHKQLIYPSRDRSSLSHFEVQSVDDIDMVDPVAVGDDVLFSDALNDEGLITEVLPRRSKLTRRASGEKPLEQVIVANVDQIVAVTAAAQPAPKWNMMDRYLAGAEASSVPMVICITKLDLVRGKKQERKLMETVDEYRNIGYTVHLTSSMDGFGVEPFRHAMKDKTSALVGMSGVGKTTLLNAIQPELGLRVMEINKRIDKGRHTTTHLEMFSLEMGGAVVDTPGMKLFGLWQIEPEEMDFLYREIAPYHGLCKFGASCTHDHEPDCAVKTAVESGEISERRYESYLNLREYVFAKGK
jgi:ribosome biogenesis GTPase